jgi:hypothetical protein
MIAIVVSLATPALATEPCDCPASLAYTPDANATNVPTNVALFVSHPALDPSKVLLSTGPLLVPTQFEMVDSLIPAAWVRPMKALDPTTQYRLDDGTVHLSFTTGTAADTTPPTVGSATVAGTSFEGACADTTAAEVMPSGFSDDLTPARSLLLRIDVTGPNDRGSVYLPASSAVLGSSQDCINTYPKARSGVGYTATVTAFDWAGNASSPSAPASFKFKFTAGVCAMGGGHAPSGLGVLACGALAWLLARRRRGGSAAAHARR